MTQLKPLATLPFNNIQYRIDLIGDIRRNPACSQNHLVDIYIREQNERFVSPNEILDRSFYSDKVQRTQISIGEMSLYSPLSIISNGKIVFNSETPNIIKKIQPTEATTQFITANQRDHEWLKGEYLIPYSSLPLGIGLSTTLVALESDGDPFSLLIPVSEVIRYFYLSSSRFNQFLFSSEVINNDILIDEKQSGFDPITKTVFLKLRKQFKNSDAGIIAEFLYSKVARKNAKRIWGGLIKLAHDSSVLTYSPRVGFPFSGQGNLRAIGIDIPTPNYFSKKRKLVLKIIDCKYTLPFNSINFFRDNPGHAAEERNEQNESNGTSDKPFTSYPVAITNNREGKNDPQSTPQSGINSVQIDILNNRFTHIPITNLHTTSTSNKQSISDVIYIQKKDQSTSATTSSQSDSAPINIGPKTKRIKSRKTSQGYFNKGDIFDHIEKVISIIKSKKGIKVSTVKVHSTREDNTSNFPGGYSSWSEFCCPRRAYVFEIIIKDRHYYILEVERYKSEYYSTILYYSSELKKIEKELHSSLLRALSCNSFYKYDSTLKSHGFKFVKIRHTTPNRQAQKILRHIT